MNLENVYKVIKAEYYSDCEEFEVVKKVEEFRNFWKPSQVRIILLAESHVFTTLNELFVKSKIRSEIDLPYYPDGFTRFVYCLSYGENETLSSTINKNTGTPQYWKIFFSCQNKINSNIDFSPILKTRTPNLAQRLLNKKRLLEDLRNNGIWLLDASMFSLYRPGGVRPADSWKSEIINLCWDNYLDPKIYTINPSFIAVIGKGVGEILEEKIRQVVGNKYCIFHQPQSRRLSQQEHLSQYKNYYKICTEY